MLKPTWPSNGEQDNLNIPAMDQSQREGIGYFWRLPGSLRNLELEEIFEREPLTGIQNFQGYNLVLVGHMKDYALFNFDTADRSPR